MAILHEPAVIALEPRDRLEFTLVGEGREPYITPKVVGVAMGKLSTIEPLTAIVPSPSIEISKVAAFTAHSLLLHCYFFDIVYIYYGKSLATIPFIISIYSKPASGKSHLMKYILCCMRAEDKIDILFFFTSTKKNEFYDNMVDTRYVMRYSEKFLAQFWKPRPYHKYSRCPGFSRATA